MSEFLNEIKILTEIAVSKKQGEAVLNYPKIKDKIKACANAGASECKITLSGMNEFDMKLLKDDGFNVHLADIQISSRGYSEQLGQYNPEKKQWVIKW
jgi:hypothetical protein